jgi:hypothetical protein
MIAQMQKAHLILSVDILAQALQKAKTLGATHTIQIQPNDAPESTHHKLKAILEDGGANDVLVNAAGFSLTSAMVVHATCPAGRMFQVGPPSKKAAPVPMGLVAGKELESMGLQGFAADDLPNWLQWVTTGKLDPSLLVEGEVTLQEGCQALQNMDHTSPWNGHDCQIWFGRTQLTATSQERRKKSKRCPEFCRRAHLWLLVLLQKSTCGTIYVCPFPVTSLLLLLLLLVIWLAKGCVRHVMASHVPDWQSKDALLLVWERPGETDSI